MIRAAPARMGRGGAVAALKAHEAAENFDVADVTDGGSIEPRLRARVDTSAVPAV